MKLNLDPTFKPFGSENELSFETLTFSGGEPHIRIQSESLQDVDVTITCRINSFNDLGFLLVAVDALKRLQAASISVFMPYFPGARQDRLMVPGEALTVKVYADILNSLGLRRITVFDPHSEVTPAVLNNCETLTNHGFVKSVMSSLPDDVVLISPDGGALKKVYKLAPALGGKEVVECSKTRDVSTGVLSGFKVYADDLSGKTCLVVDDICDGGGTFLGLAEALKAKGAAKLVLVVSHGIFSKGLDKLNEAYDNIFTTNSVRDLDEPNVTQLDFTQFLNQ